VRLNLLPCLELFAWVSEKDEDRAHYFDDEGVGLLLIVLDLRKEMLGIEVGERLPRLGLHLARQQHLDLVEGVVRSRERRERRRLADVRALDVLDALLDHRPERMQRGDEVLIHLCAAGEVDGPYANWLLLQDIGLDALLLPTQFDLERLVVIRRREHERLPIPLVHARVLVFEGPAGLPCDVDKGMLLACELKEQSLGGVERLSDHVHLPGSLKKLANDTHVAQEKIVWQRRRRRDDNAVGAAVGFAEGEDGSHRGGGVSSPMRVA